MDAMGTWSFGDFMCVVFVAVWVFGYWIRSRSEKFGFFSRLGITGPAPSVWDGNFKELFRNEKAPWLVMNDWIQQYGKVFGYYRTGPAPMLVVTDHEMLKEILIKEFSHFSDRSVLTSPPKRLPRMFRGSLTLLTGQDWKRVRSTLTPTFTAKKMKAMSPTINEVVDVLLSIMEGKAQTGETTNIYQLLQGLTLDVIGSCAFAMHVDCQRNPDDVFLETVRGIFRNANNPLVRIIQMFPEFNFIISRALRPFATNFKRGKFITENLQAIIRQRKEGKLNGHVDMIQLMIDASEGTDSLDSGSADSTGFFADVRKKYLTEDEMISNAFVFLLAGFETTANCLGFTTYLLAKHPEIQDRLFDEIRENIGLTLTPDYDRVQRLPYLEMVIAESLRLFPPVSNFVTRVASESVTVNGLTIPAKTGIEVPLWHMHHDPDVWDKPYTFDPERFSPENKPSIPPMAYLPFGAGPRNCIGMRFAQLEIKIALVRVLQRYKLLNCKESEPEMQLQHGIATINPKNGVFVKVEKRDN